ncbi:MAG: hypothetical protein HXS41_09390 [Theionarchaea archaeon]|nr:hypothetical protein [Theionarchaea archaeon]MBU7000419.1 hypothetical protein [Theionarchaea archaeon]MBU7021261.1 hypothetical protein [Theionarchaea archaeon]MBU7035296.1 hypothetical protein [Theionarchaea archaeon]MBU7039753.1 hypothetical protein [Theionarchaea archaeon]
MKAISLNKKLWTDVTMDSLDFVSPDCEGPLINGCGGGGCYFSPCPPWIWPCNFF